MADINFGRRQSKDERDKNYMMKRLLAPAGTVLPTSKKWPIASKNLDQGNFGTCVGNAWTNFLRCAPIQSTADESMALKIYDSAILLDEWTDNDQDAARQMGTSVRGGAMAVAGMKRLASYLWAFDLQPAVEWVLTKGPVVLGTTWYDSMMKPDVSGIVQIKPRAKALGGHAYLWRGADTKLALAYCCNSWGDDWGLSGNFAIPFRDLETLIHDDGEACTAVQRSLKAAAL
jgi:hypothetical protein